MCVKNTASSCAGKTFSWESRIVVPRPVSNCIFMVLQPSDGSPYRTNVPAPARPLKAVGPGPVPVKVTTKHGAAHACTIVARSQNETASRTFIGYLFCNRAPVADTGAGTTATESLRTGARGIPIYLGSCQA